MTEGPIKGRITHWHNIQMPMGSGPPPSQLLGGNGGRGGQPQSLGVGFLRMETPHAPGDQVNAEEAQRLLGIVQGVLASHLGGDLSPLMGRVLDRVADEWPERRSLVVSNLFYVTYEPPERGAVEAMQHGEGLIGG